MEPREENSPEFLSTASKNTVEKFLGLSSPLSDQQIMDRILSVASAVVREQHSRWPIFSGGGGDR